MQFTLEPMAEHHGRAVIDVYNHFIAHSMAAYPDAPVGYEFFGRFLQMTQGYPAYVVTVGAGQVVGFGFLRPFHPAPTLRRTAEVTYFLLPEYTHQGIGTALLNRLLEQAGPMGIDSLVANISSKNEASLRFHSKNGFRECGRLERAGRKSGQDFDIVWMQRPLTPASYFDRSAAAWDHEPRRIALMKDVGEAILRQAMPRADMDVLDYGCGTGLVGLFLLPHVRSVTGADNSPGMLEVLGKKIAERGIRNMQVMRLDLEADRVPDERYHLIVTSMTLHHVADTGRVLRAFHSLLHPGGMVCIADLDTEPGIFHPPEAAGSVHHHGFDRNALKGQLAAAGFTRMRDVTAHTVYRPVENGVERGFPVFLITAER